MTPDLAACEKPLAAGLAALQLGNAVLQERLLVYLRELVLWNRAYNLTAVRDPVQMVTRHLLDSLVTLPYVNATVLDAGTGAGLPGVPLALADDRLLVTLLDSNGKKARFLRHVVRALGLDNAQVVEARLETFAPDQRYRTVISRAFGSLAAFFGAAARFCEPGGTLVAMKGKLSREEISNVPTHVAVRETHRLVVPGLEEERHVVLATPRA